MDKENGRIAADEARPVNTIRRRRERCQSTKIFFGGAYRCEDYRGHLSVHYNGDHWWPNKDGLPDHQSSWLHDWWPVIFWALLAIGVCVFFAITLRL
jgi:hypothetical protein